MATNFQSSFIPKESITGSVNNVSSKNILGLVGILLVIFSIAISIGLFIYKGMLGGELEQLKSNLSIAESGIDRPSIDKILIFNKKLNSIKEILAKHQASSNFMALLSSSTVSSVQFEELHYEFLNTGGLDVRLRGKSSGYTSLALQENELSKLKEVKSAKFSNLILGESGLVGFDLFISMDPSISVYNPIIEVKEVPKTSTSTISTSAQDNNLDIEALDTLDDLELTDLDNI